MVFLLNYVGYPFRLSHREGLFGREGFRRQPQRTAAAHILDMAFHLRRSVRCGH